MTMARRSMQLSWSLAVAACNGGSAPPQPSAMAEHDAQPVASRAAPDAASVQQKGEQKPPALDADLKQTPDASHQPSAPGGTPSPKPPRRSLPSAAGRSAPSAKTATRCLRPAIASGLSAQSLRAVGIVQQGDVRKALVVEPDSTAHVILVGDCLGKEKAYVKEIGINYVALTIDDAKEPQRFNLMVDPNH
jgi:hypothetical protein